MLQKVPTTRASWKYLKQHSFLQAPQLQELHTDVQIKNSISVFENIFEKIEKVDNESLEDRFNIASKVEFRIEGENSQEEIDKIDSDIQNGKANLKELKTNQLLTNKLLCIIGTACVTQ